MIKIKKTFRLASELDIDPVVFGFENFTELANHAIRQLIENSKPRDHQALDIINQLVVNIQNWEAAENYEEKGFSENHSEFIQILNLCYDFLIRSKVVLSNQDFKQKQAYSLIDQQLLTEVLNR